MPWFRTSVVFAALAAGHVAQVGLVVGCALVRKFYIRRFPSALRVPNGLILLKNCSWHGIYVRADVKEGHPMP
jgi:hypothetical protein